MKPQIILWKCCDKMLYISKNFVFLKLDKMPYISPILFPSSSFQLEGSHLGTVPLRCLLLSRDADCYFSKTIILCSWQKCWTANETQKEAWLWYPHFTPSQWSPHRQRSQSAGPWCCRLMLFLYNYSEISQQFFHQVDWKENEVRNKFPLACWRHCL